MDVKTAIYTRETIRRFTKGISDEKLYSLLEAGTWAPNHRKREPWRFIVINDAIGYKTLVDKYRELNRDIMYLEKMIEKNQFPTMVVTILQKNEDPVIYHEDLLAHGAMIQNIQLAAWSEHIGVVWKTQFVTPTFGAKIGLTENEVVTGFLLIGFFDENVRTNERTRTSITEKVMRIGE
ncbi:MAG: nitroreductase family protein [Culicoidibacterales bacterium]